MFYVRMMDWSYQEIFAETMLEMEDELVFCDRDKGIIARIPKADVRVVTQHLIVYRNK